jgi:hypothetical protein
MLAEQDLKKEADEYLKIENGKTNIAETVTDEELFDNPDWVASPQGDDVKGISTGENKIVYDDNGRPGYMISSNASASDYVGVNEEGNLALASYKEAWGDGRFTVSEDGKTKTAPEEFGGKSYPNTPEGLQQFEDDSEEFYKKEHEKTGGTWNLNIDSQTGKQSTHKTWMSIEEVEELVKENSVDTQSKGAIETMVAQSALTASELQVGENSEFNYQKNYNTVRAQIIEKGNLQSLANNKIIEGRTFKTDLFDAISDVTYEELNIEQSSIAGLSLTKEQIEEMDPSKGDGKITPVDAGVILNEIMNNEDMLKDYLAEYYTNFMEQNWNNNVKKEVGLDFSSSGSFNNAFRAAKEQLGPAAMFTWNGNKYTTGEVYTGATYNPQTSIKLIEYKEQDPNVIQYNSISSVNLNFNSFKTYNVVITKDDITIGFIRRYIIKKNNEFKFYEVDKKTYDDYQNNKIDQALYSAVELIWQITGNLNDTRDGSILIPSVQSNNAKLIQAAERTLPGLSSYLTDLLQYYSDNDNIAPADINGLD